jgi:hypothetical protein
MLTAKQSHRKTQLYTDKDQAELLPVACIPAFANSRPSRRPADFETAPNCLEVADRDDLTSLTGLDLQFHEILFYLSGHKALA